MKELVLVLAILFAKVLSLVLTIVFMSILNVPVIIHHYLHDNLITLATVLIGLYECIYLQSLMTTLNRLVKI